MGSYQKFKDCKLIMRQKIIPRFDSLGFKNEVNKLEMCGQFIHVIDCNSCHSLHYAGNTRCKSRWCINCNRIKSLAWLARLLPIMQDWIKKKNHNLFMLNFTIKDTDNLEQGLKILNDSYRYMTNGDKYKRKIWKSRFKGIIRSLEVKTGSGSGKWHPHLHCIVLQDHYAKYYEDIKREWEHAVYLQTGDQKGGSVWIKKIKGDNLTKSIIETIKYIFKGSEFNDISDENLKEMYMNLKGKRQINTSGCLRGLKKDIDKDIDTLEEKKLTEFICQKCGCTEGQLRSILENLLDDKNIYDIG